MGDFEVKEIKTGIAALTALFTYISGSISSIIYILIFMMIADYVTGIIDAAIHGEISSSAGAFGILKKVCIMCIVILGYFLDFIIVFVASYINLFSIENLTIGFGMLVTLWFIGNEGVSILENMDSIGVKMPKFLKKAFKQMRDKSDNAGGSAIKK